MKGADSVAVMKRRLASTARALAACAFAFSSASAAPLAVDEGWSARFSPDAKKLPELIVTTYGGK